MTDVYKWYSVEDLIKADDSAISVRFYRGNEIEPYQTTAFARPAATAPYVVGDGVQLSSAAQMKRPWWKFWK